MGERVDMVDVVDQSGERDAGVVFLGEAVASIFQPSILPLPTARAVGFSFHCFTNFTGS
jgi:hypothetical protein